MIEYFLGLCFTLSIWILFQFFIRPIYLQRKYIHILNNLGYKVFVHPFAFLGVSYMKNIAKGMKDHDDALYIEKYIYPTVDFAIGNILNVVYISIINLDVIKEFYATENLNTYLKFTRSIDGIKYLLGDGILFSEGVAWKNKRKAISHVFTFDLLKENITKIAQICDNKMYSMELANQTREHAFTYDVLELGTRIFNGVIMKCFFGQDNIQEKIQGEPYETIVTQLIEEASLISVSPLVYIMGRNALKYGLTKRIRNLKQKIAIFRAISLSIIEKRVDQVKNTERKKQKSCGTDLIQALTIKRQNISQLERIELQFSNKQLLDQFCTFIVAGTDSTSHFFMMMVYQIAQNPEIELKLRKLIDQHIKTNADLTYQNLKKLTYLQWIQKETIRFYGPVNNIFVRIASKDNYLSNVPLFEGTGISVQPKGNHYNPNIFKDPAIFRPQRWESECQNLHPFSLIGFSAGPRTCIGKHLALLQSKIAIIKLLQRYPRIILPPMKRVMEIKFLYQPVPFKTTFYTSKQ